MSESESERAGGPVTAVVAAMPEELAPLRSRLHRQLHRIERTGRGPLVMESGWLEGRRLVLAATGDGERNARAGVAALLAASGAEALVVIGVAGALTRGLGAGALVVANRVVREDGRSVDADERRVASAARATGGRAAIVLSAARIADSAGEKQRLARSVGAGDGPAVVDLESSTYVAAAAAAGVPWLVLRAVSDTAEEDLPALLNRSRDDGGAVRRGRVLLGLLGEPRALPALLALRGRVARCAEVLAAAFPAVLPTFSTLASEGAPT
jgi:nucleoside phosphorylase